MTRHIEIEFKNMVTETEFLALIEHFSIEKEAFILQKNYYFETPAFALRTLRAALRIREKQDQFELTLKEEKSFGQLETTQPLLEQDAYHIIRTEKLPAGPVLSRLHELRVDAGEIQYAGILETLRAEIPYKGGLLVLDRSSYFQKVDFEVEYEVEDPIEGKNVFYTLLHNLQIPVRKSKNKIARFFAEKKRLEDETGVDQI